MTDQDENKASDSPADTEMTPEQALTVAEEARADDDLLIWAIYDSPSDHPGMFIARPWRVMREGVYYCHLAAETLEAIRLALPPGLTRMNRMSGDETCIVETWV